MKIGISVREETMQICTGKGCLSAAGFLSYHVLQQDSFLTEFDETLWFAVIDKVTVYANDNIQFTFRDGTVIKYNV